MNTYQALIAIAGSCRIFVDSNDIQEEYYLDSPEKCLLLAPEDWHTMNQFHNDTILLVVANTLYDPNDYIFEPYNSLVMVSNA
jgi:hypothetical protein